MTTHAPRPALRKAADAHIHPAAPGHRDARSLRPAPHGAVPEPAIPPDDLLPSALRAAPAGDSPAAAPADGAAPAQGAGAPHRLSGPLRGTTSDSLRGAVKNSRREGAARTKERTVELTVKVPKSLRKEFRAALKADRKDQDQVVTALLQAWLRG